jgi:pantetheine-phosphate adenylyltransferase
MRRAVYAGSFDPLTFGHLDLIQRGVALFDELVVALGTNVRKTSLLPLPVREDVLRRVLAPHGVRVRVDTFDGLLVDYCRQVEAGFILRGLRAVTDFEFEFQTGLANKDMAPGVDTVFLLTDPRHIFVSSTLIKEIARMGGDVARYVPAEALAVMGEALAAQRA